MIGVYLIDQLDSD